MLPVVQLREQVQRRRQLPLGLAAGGEPHAWQFQGARLIQAVPAEALVDSRLYRFTQGFAVFGLEGDTRDLDGHPGTFAEFFADRECEAEVGH